MIPLIVPLLLMQLFGVVNAEVWTVTSVSSYVWVKGNASNATFETSSPSSTVSTPASSFSTSATVLPLASPVFDVGSDHFLALNFKLTLQFNNDTSANSSCTGRYSDGYVAPKPWLPCDNGDVVFRLVTVTSVSDFHLEIMTSSIEQVTSATNFTLPGGDAAQANGVSKFTAASFSNSTSNSTSSQLLCSDGIGGGPEASCILAKPTILARPEIGYTPLRGFNIQSLTTELFTPGDPNCTDHMVLDVKHTFNDVVEVCKQSWLCNESWRDLTVENPVACGTPGLLSISTTKPPHGYLGMNFDVHVHETLCLMSSHKSVIGTMVYVQVRLAGTKEIRYVMDLKDCDIGEGCTYELKKNGAVTTIDSYQILDGEGCGPFQIRNDGIIDHPIAKYPFDWSARVYESTT